MTREEAAFRRRQIEGSKNWWRIEAESAPTYAQETYARERQAAYETLLASHDAAEAKEGAG